MGLFAFAAWGLTPPPPEAFAVESTVGSWGEIPVVYAPDPDAHSLTAQWVFDTGAADDPVGEGGRAHLLEHLSFGPLGLPDDPAMDVDALLGRYGGETEGWTDRDRSGVGALVPVLAHGGPDEYYALLVVEQARGAAPHPDASAVGTQLRVVRMEASEAADRPHGLDRIWLDALLWSPGAPWARHPQAMAELDAAAARAAAADVRARFDTHRPGRRVLVVAGAFPEKTAAFPLPQGEVEPSVSMPERCDPAPPARAWRRADVAEGAVYFAWPTVPRTHPDRVALEAIARWMGGARVASGRDCGEFVVERRGGWWRTGEHARALRRSVEGLGRSGLPGPTLDRLRMAQLTDLARGLASLPVRARLLGSCLLTTGDPDCLPDEVRRWNHLDPEAIRSAAARWLEWNAVTILAVLPSDTALAPPIAGIRQR